MTALQKYSLIALVGTMSFAPSCKHRKADSDTAGAGVRLSSVAEQFPMQVLYDSNGSTKVDPYELTNGISAAVTYGIWTNRFRNGFGQASLRTSDANGMSIQPDPEKPMTQIIRILSGFDLYMTSVIKRIANKNDQATNATIILMPANVSGPGGAPNPGYLTARGFAPLESTTLDLPIVAAIRSAFGVINPFSQLRAFRIPQGEINYDGAHFAKYEHADFYHQCEGRPNDRCIGKLQMAVNSALVDRYEQIVTGWNRTATPSARLFYLANLYSPLAMVSQVKVGSKNEDSFLYTEFYFAAPGFLKRDGQSVAEWTVDGFQTKLGPKDQVKTDFAVLDTFTYAGASYENRNSYPLMRVSISKQISSRPWSQDQDPRHNRARVHVAFGQHANSASSAQAGDLVHLNNDNARQMSLTISGRMGLKEPKKSKFEMVNDALIGSIRRINSGLNQLTLSLSIVDLELELSRAPAKSAEDAFRRDDIFQLRYRPEGSQGVVVTIAWPINEANLGKVGKYMVSKLKSRVGLQDANHVSDVFLKCDSTECSITIPVKYLNDNLGDVSTFSFAGLMKKVKDIVKDEVGKSANAQIASMTKDLDNQLAEMMTSAFDAIEGNRRSLMAKFELSPEFSKVAKSDMLPGNEN